MKLGAIKRCCVEEKEFYIYESDCGEQWIGTHTAAWPVEGDLKLTEGSIAAIFDLKPKKAAQMDVLALPLNRMQHRRQGGMHRNLASWNIWASVAYC